MLLPFHLLFRYIEDPRTFLIEAPLKSGSVQGNEGDWRLAFAENQTRLSMILL